IWDIASRRILKELEINGTIHSVAFSQDGSRILSSSDDSLVHVWDAHTYDSLLQGAEASAPLDEFNPATFSPDRTLLVTISEGDATVWQVFASLESMIHYAQVFKARKLTPEECRKLVGDTSSTVCQQGTSIRHVERLQPPKKTTWEYIY